MAGAAARPVAGLARPDPRPRCGRRARLDSQSTARLGRPMASGVHPKLIPPAEAPAFLAAHGWDGAEIRPLAGDASFRRYFRVVDGDRRAVLMDAPPPHEDPRPFIAAAE